MRVELNVGVENVAHNIMTRAFSISQLTVSTVELNVGRWECRSQYYGEGIQHFSTYRIYSWTQRWALRMSLTILWQGHSAFLNLPYLQLNSMLGVENVAHNIMTRAFSISQLTISIVELNVGRWECHSQYYDEGIQQYSTYRIYCTVELNVGRWECRPQYYDEGIQQHST
jgi:hypothetical protein